MRLLTITLALWVALAAGSACNSAPPAASPMAFERDLLGTRFRILLHHDDAEVAARAAEAAFARVEELDGILSDYDSGSELRRLARSGVGTHDVSPELHAVLALAERLQVETDGAFDVRTGGLTRLWRRARRRGELPAAEGLARALERLQAGSFSASQVGMRVSLTADDLELDLGGLAKGFVLDEVLVVLAEHGVHAALVDGGGDLVASGPPPGRDAWTVVVSDLPGLEGEPLVLPLVRGALATSGDTYQHLELDGVVHSHLVDPRTGQALTDRAAATVLAPTAVVADGLASALCVLEPAAGLGLLAERAGCAARIGRGTGDALQVWTSPDFPAAAVE